MSKAHLLLGVGLVAAAGMAYASRIPAQVQEEGAAPADFGGDLETAGDSFNLWTEQLMQELDTAPQAPAHASDQNRRAALHTIKVAEGTFNAGGYQALYGSTPRQPRTFTGFADHPRIVSRISSTDSRWTSAAGAYQWMAISPIPGGGFTRTNTWDRLKKKLNLPDFSPESQDRAALELFREYDALDDVDAGRILEAFRKVRSQWASLPGANYEGQGMRSPSFLIAQYEAAGGTRA